MKTKTMVMALFVSNLLMFALGFPVFGDDENPRRSGRPAAEKAARDLRERGPELQSQRRLGNGPPASRDPAQFVAMLMRQFDKDGDQKLDSQELAALLTSMRDRQAPMGGQQPMGPMQANRFRPGGVEGRRGGDGTDEAGGVTPKRPPVEE